MTTFWLLAAALMAATMTALLVPLLRRPPAASADVPTEGLVDWYRGQLRETDADLHAGTLDAAGHAQARAELGRRLLDDAGGEGIAMPSLAASSTSPPRRRVLLAALLLAVLPSTAVMLYLHLGNPAALWAPGNVPEPIRGGHAVSETQIEAMVNQLAQRLRETPDDAPGWAMLARSYGVLERHADAAAAYARAVALAPDVAPLRADYADALATLQDGKLAGAPTEQVERALALDPDEPKALALAASAAVERGDVRGAIAYWEHLYKMLPAESQTARQVAANLEAARAALETLSK